MNKLNIILSIVISAICTVTTAQKETTLLKIGNQTTSVEEYKYIYNKNNSSAQVPISQNEYYELFVNYKLKAAEARAQKLDTLNEYKQECEHYLNELAKPYLTDTIAVKEAKQQLRERFKEEICASHILIRLDEESTPEDTMKAYLRIADARRRILDGEDFEKVARQCSDDPSVKNNGGRIDYFSALQMVTPFEDAAYNTKKGSVSNIFRSQFGYHFLRVEDRRPFSGEIQVAHIMKALPRNASQEIKDKVKAQIDSLYDAIQKGEDFSKIARNYSDDRQSASRGGEMPWFTTNQIISEFSEKAFALKENGEISKPFLTPYGWHIIKRLNRRDMRPDTEINSIIDRASRGGHPIASVGLKAKGHSLMKDYKFTWNTDVCDEVAAIILSNAPDSIKSNELSEIIKPLATYDNGVQLTTEQLSHNLRLWNRTTTPYENFDRLAVDAIIKYEKSKLPQKYPEYRYTMQEYYDGLLVFEINQRTIWSDANIDTIALKNLYHSNIARYSVGGTFDGDIYFCDDIKSAQKLKSSLKNKKNKIAKKAQRTISGEQKQGGIYDDYIWPNIASKYVVVDGKITQGTPIPFDQIKGLLISDYQQRAEIEWIKELRTKYQPKTIGKLK